MVPQPSYAIAGHAFAICALDVRTGKVQGKTAARHISEEFVSFLDQVVRGCEPKLEVHLILGNLSTHKTAKVRGFLDQNPNVHLHYTLLWLNGALVCAHRA